ncbi:MAG: site-specific DNA-methyltransferase [Clostridiaceae bacterium]|nr:site-specific DNA-methyltransferase [Clostridiaceae bacterium]
MPNLSQKKRERMLAFLDKIREEHKDDDDALIALGEVEAELNAKKYGLIWEEHEEAVDVMMRTHIPVFTEDVDKEISAAPGGIYNFLLEGDNLHSLRLLEKTHRGRIDVIYIDPPYNTGSRDFVYDDAYVDDNDGFKHSKWLSFLNERLLAARNLLKKDGVIVISIGYQEVHNLMLLCQEIFSDRQLSCITIQTSGGKPNGGFTYVHEYLVFVTPSDFSPKTMSFTGGISRSPFEGLTLSTFDKTTRPNQAYPIFIDRKTMNLVGTGKSLTERLNEGSYFGELSEFPFDYDEAPEGTAALWPISSKGAECVWRLIPERLMNDWEKGYIKISKNKSKANPNEYSVQYLPEGVIEKISNNELEVVGKEEDAPTLIFGENKTVGGEIPTIWTEKEFHTTKGTAVIKEIFGDKRFSYPKPLELIIEILRAVTNEKSIVLDFFAGSGTTGQACIELNQRDAGKRQFIICTNNESNICHTVTYPRLQTIISGKRENGSKYSDGIPANLKYYHTDFVARDEEYLSDALLGHITEMIQLEHGVKLDGKRYIMVMDDVEADALEQHWGEYPDAQAMYISKNVLFTTTQVALFSNTPQFIIPDNYFKFELQEEGESW